MEIINLYKVLMCPVFIYKMLESEFGGRSGLFGSRKGITKSRQERGP